MKFIPRWRFMTWVLVGWCVLILAWAISAGESADCPDERLTEACEAGTGIGIALILFIGFVGFVFFGLIWFMTRTRYRDCPACGRGVKKGQTACKNCGHDFAAATP